MSGKLIITENDEKFTRSNCECEFCVSTHKSVKEWDTFVPETNLQYKMIETIANIENREKRITRGNIKK
jgi:hypothetical protein